MRESNKTQKYIATEKMTTRSVSWRERKKIENEATILL